MSICETEFAAIDFESAGALAGAGDAPVQIGIAVLANGKILPDKMLRSYIACERPITWNARKVHGISEDALSHAPSLPSLWPALRDLLRNRYVVAHGAATERRFLRAFPLHGFGPWVDTLAIARAADPMLDSYALGDLCRHYDLEATLKKEIADFRWHDAYCDSVASLHLLLHIVSLHHLDHADPAVLLAPDQSHYKRRIARKKS